MFNTVAILVNNFKHDYDYVGNHNFTSGYSIKMP